MTQTSLKHSKRVQTMLTAPQFDLLSKHATQVNKPISVLVRETIEEMLLKELRQQRKRRALEWMTAQELPVDDWEVMERQVESRWEECWDE